jgi:hypothetical protein|tara:strand:+ start:60 stop:659 length:600 start_codon:yes stop_codon:yes gene_type:complete
MNEKGQIMTIDFLISVAAVTLAIGLMIQFAEIKTYNEKDDIAWLELKEIAESAADRLVGSPEIVCELVDTYDETTSSYYPSMNDAGILRIGSLDNCIPKINAVGHRIEKADLGIPAGYDCDIDNDAVSAETLQTGCADNLPADTDYYSVTKKVVLLTGTGNPENKNRVAKVDWENCRGNTTVGSCTLEESDTILKVWKT